MNARLDLTGRIADYFITSRLTPVFVLFCLLVGAIAAWLTPREENPQIVVPGAEITYALPGRSASEVEHLVVAPIEGILREIEGVDHTFAIAAHGMGQVTVQFDVGIDKDEAMVRVYQRVMSDHRTLPPDTGLPLVRRVDVDDVPIVNVTLASEIYDDYALHRLAERVEERLSTIEEVSVTRIHGGRSREIRIELDPARLDAFGLTMNQGIAMLEASNVAAVVGNTVRQRRNLIVNLGGQLTSAAEIRRLALSARSGQLIYVEDVASVFDGPPVERDSLTRFAYGAGDPAYAETRAEMPAVTLSVAKKIGTNAVFVARDVLAKVAQMERQFIPDEVRVITTRNDGVTANNTVNDLIVNLGIAIAAVLLVLLPFLGIRAGLIISGAVPLILCLTLAVDMLIGPTINRMSLFALILSLGMIVDAGIVTIENIYRHYQLQPGAEPRALTVAATQEIGQPTNMATLAIILVFSSLGIVSGMNGEFFYPITFNVPVTIGLSLLVAYVVVPWASHRWLRGRVPPATAARPEHNVFYRIYFRCITPLLERPRLRIAVFLLTTLIILASFLQPAWQFIRPAGVDGPLSAGGVMLAIMPKDDKNTFNITLDMPEDTPIEITDRVAREFGALAGAHPLVANYLTYVGIPAVIDFAGQIRGNNNRRGPHVAELSVNLIDKQLRDTKSMEVVRELRVAAEPLKHRYPGLDVRFVESPPGPPTRATVLAEIYGPDPEVLRRAAALVRERFERTYMMVDVFDTQTADIPRLDIRVDKEKAVLSGVTTSAIEHSLQSLMDGRVVSQAHIPGEKTPVPILIKVPRSLAIDPTLLDRIHIDNTAGERVPLSELTRVEPGHHDRPILRKDNERVTYVGGELTDSAPVYAILAMDPDLDGLDLGGGNVLHTDNITLQPVLPSTLDGYKLLWDGELRLTLDAWGEMAVVLGAAVLFIFLLLVGTYQSFIIPLVAMTSIPLGLAGIFPGHWLLGIPFSMASAIGTVALAGVVIRNALLIIDFIRDYQRQGKPLEEAVRLAGAVRFRPILLTAVTVILGTLVMYTDPLFAGLATSLIFGTTASTVLTLLILPSLYYQLATRHPRWFLTD